MTSSERNVSHESRMPQSSASQSRPVLMLLLASRFMPTTDKHSSVRVMGGTDCTSDANSDQAFFMMASPCILEVVIKQHLRTYLVG